ncbi:MAG: monofunctional biosynthetic peptidoglycan transglycosylase [Desulfobacterales bacterium]|nr:monofunctional biosynthetic peptidoglycan transglycosylase [Desulfobacterales bacterium]
MKKFMFFLLLMLLLAGGGVVFIYLSMPAVSHLKIQNPPTTALIEQRIREAQRAGNVLKIRQVWVGFDGIPALLKESVRVAEDARFYDHEGIDYEEISEALKKNLEQGRWARGASTITQQLAKNLYLSTEKTLIRKLKEYFLALQLEKELSKRRIFHLYLNVIELGPGIFGVEAAARHYFGKSVGQMSLEEIVRLTAVIPKPLSESPVRQSRWLKWKARWILSILYKTGHIRADQYHQAGSGLK